MSEHGPLSPQLKQEFLLRGELAYIITHDPADIRACINAHRQLRIIAECLRYKAMDRLDSQIQKPNSNRTKGQTPSKQTGSSARTGRSRKAGEVWNPPASRGSSDPRYK